MPYIAAKLPRWDPSLGVPIPSVGVPDFDVIYY